MTNLYGKLSSEVYEIDKYIGKLMVMLNITMSV